VTAAEDLSVRLGLLETRQELWDLIGRYCLAVDSRDPAALRELFTSDATFDPTESIEVDPVPVGRDQLVAYYLAGFERLGKMYHYPHSQLVELDTVDDAHGTVLAHAELGLDRAPFRVSVRYHDRYAREDGHWRFRSRRVEQIDRRDLLEVPATQEIPS
jgi:hypothetical protein